MQKILIVLASCCSVAHAISWKLINNSDANAKIELYSPEGRTASGIVNAGKSANLELSSTNEIEEWETIKAFKAPYGEGDLIQMIHLPQPIRFPDYAEVTLTGKLEKYNIDVKKIEAKSAWWQKLFN